MFTGSFNIRNGRKRRTYRVKLDGAVCHEGGNKTMALISYSTWRTQSVENRDEAAGKTVEFWIDDRLDRWYIPKTRKGKT